MLLQCECVYELDSVCVCVCTLHEVRMVRLVRGEHCGHLIMISGVDVLINTVPRQLYLLK